MTTDDAPDPAVDALERRWRATPLATGGTIHALVCRTGPGLHGTPDAVVLRAGDGVVGDRWATGKPPVFDAQVSLIERRIVELLAGERTAWHLAGDNLVVDLDLSAAALPVGARLAVGDVVLEVSPKPHLGCATFRARLGDSALRWVNARDHRERRLRGVYARVLVGGTVRRGDRLRPASR